jgi:hypothetical protein
MNNHHTNIVRIVAVARALVELNEEVVFIGGAVVSLYSNKPELMDLRVTDDVDIVIEIANRGKYIQLQERLRALGFQEDIESNVICRWKINGIVVDIMPNDPDIIGFTNPWYEEGYKHKIVKTVKDIEVNIFSAPYFLATKLVALKTRPSGPDGKAIDWRWSQDFEDIVKVINEIDLFEHLAQTSGEIKLFLKSSFDEIRTDDAFLEEAISANLVQPFYTDDDIENIIEKINHIADDL